MNLLRFFQQSKERKAIRLAKRLRATLISLGYNKPEPGVANCINIWEFDHGGCHIKEYESNIHIDFKV